MQVKEFSTSGNSGFTGMMKDISRAIVFMLTNTFGLAMTMLCLFIYLLILYITGGLKTIGLILSILAFVGFVILSWMHWFRQTSDDSDE
jgi:energy-converting hydrogenase Eha subunit F